MAPEETTLTAPVDSRWALAEVRRELGAVVGVVGLAPSFPPGEPALLTHPWVSVGREAGAGGDAGGARSPGRPLAAVEVMAA